MVRPKFNQCGLELKKEILCIYLLFFIVFLRKEKKEIYK